MQDQFTIFVDEKPWRVGRCRGDDIQVAVVPGTGAQATGGTASLSAQVEAVRTQLTVLDYAQQPAVLALGSSWCLCATVSTLDLERGGRRRALGYRLEEHLPISAEQFIADYVEYGKGQALGVGTELDKLQALVEALTAAGIVIEHICPAALLVGAALAREHTRASGALLGPGRGSDPDPAPRAGYDLVAWERGRPTQWWWLAQDEAGVRERVTAWAAAREKSSSLVVVDDGVMVPHVRHDCPELECHLPPGLTADRAAVQQAGVILEGGAAPWIDLRRGPLAAPSRWHMYRRSLMVLATAAVLLVAGVIGVAQWRGRRYAALSDEYRRQQVEIFHQALPQQRVPVDIKSRLSSEQRRLAGLGGQSLGGEEERAFHPVSALTHLSRFLRSLPPEGRFRILDLSIAPDLIRVDGQAATHMEAEQLAAALRQTGAYEVEPPKTQALADQGVSFIFTAVPHQDEPPAPGGAR